ncbi:MAG: hypothetical protein GYA36_19975 [Veillonellaceae bacterium]|nr:hypothetical protein [Veillonellaceae bacterium]
MDLFLNTGDIQNAATQLRNKASDMESAIQTAETAINPLRSFKSPRISRDLEAWDSIKSTFDKALQSLLEAADELVKAAEANEAANQ